MPIPECEIHKIQADQRCQVRTEAFPDRVYAGVVSRVMPVANRVESAIPIRVKIVVPKDEEGIYLKPEMIARVSFLSGARQRRVRATRAQPFASCPFAGQNEKVMEVGAARAMELQIDTIRKMKTANWGHTGLLA